MNRCGRVGLTIVSVLVVTPAALADCPVIKAEIRSAIEAGDTAPYPNLHNELIATSDCTVATRDQLGRAMALSVLKTLPEDAKRTMIEADVLRYGRPWQALVALGDVYYAERAWAEAVPIYEEALDDMRDVVANPKPPPVSVERRTFQRAIEARALAPEYVATRKSDDGPSGLASPVFRSIVVEAVPVPVRFETGSAALTAVGRAAVIDMHASLARAASDYVAIVGHTDPRGSETYNADLSLRRAQTVAVTLRQLGYVGALDVYGFGESQRFKPSDPTRYTQEELWALDRRVEYRLEPPDGASSTAE